MAKTKPDGAHRCAAYAECAHWAFRQINGKWYCDECARFVRKMQTTELTPYHDGKPCIIPAEATEDDYTEPWGPYQKSG